MILEINRRFFTKAYFQSDMKIIFYEIINKKIYYVFKFVVIPEAKV